MKITLRTALEIAHHEAVIRQAYRDSVGVWTWSVGLTNATGHNVERYIDKPQTMQHCLDIWVWAMGKYADQVREAFRGHDLTEAQFAAALSFHWNTGAIGRASWVKHFKAGRIEQAKVAFMAWNKPSEIIGRRKAERDLFFDGVWSNTGTITEYTRVTQKHTPVWSSAKRVDVTKELTALLGEKSTGELEPPPQKPSSFWAFILSLFGGKK